MSKEGATLWMPSEEQVGMGGEKKVFLDRNDLNKVVKVYKESCLDHSKEITPNYLKGEFYLTKILHFLFPRNIPNMHGASGKTNSTRHERARLTDPRHVRLQELAKLEKEGLSVDGGKEMNSLCEEIMRDPNFVTLDNALSELLPRFFDDSAVNFGYDAEGSMLFVDSPPLWRSHNRQLVRSYDANKIRTRIAEKPDSREKQKALRYLDRLEKLYEEEKYELKNRRSKNK